MKNVLWALAVGAMLASCSSKPDKSLDKATITVVDEGAKDAGLDLQALGELVKKSPSAAKLEEALNTSGSINNLDLDGDGKVDYIKVAEAGSGNARELKFTDQLPDSTTKEVAHITINKTPDNQASMDIDGDQQIYGNNSSYHSGFSFGEVLFMAYLFSPHVPYYSPWGYRRYPGYYRSYAPVPMTTYRRTVTTYNSHPTGGRLAAPAPSRSSSSAASHSLGSPTSSQRAYTVRNDAKPVGSGGFGGHKTSSSSSSAPSSSSSSSSGGFGGHSSGSSSSSSSSSSRGFGGHSSSSRSSSSSSRSSSRSYGGRRH